MKPLQITFKGEILEMVERLQKHSGVKNRVDVIRDAIKIYYELDKISTRNGKVHVSSGFTAKVLTLPTAREA